MDDIGLELRNLEALFKAREKWLRPGHIGDGNEMVPRNPFLPPLADEDDPWADMRERLRAS